MTLKPVSIRMVALGIAIVLSSPAVAQAGKSSAAPQLTPEQAADRQVWMDEHARWNAEHMAAARRIEEIAGALRRHDTGFDLHGAEVRNHGTGTAASETPTQAHPRLRTAHEQARNVHDDLMEAVDTLSRVLRKNLGKSQSFPPAPDRP